jgi:hypothetical protein
MRLASPQQLLALLGIQASSGGLKAAEDALDASFSSVEQAAESRLVSGSLTDTFYLPDTIDPVLRLTSGFLSSDRVTVTGAGTPQVLVSKQEGVVRLKGRHPGEVSVRYMCGFHPDADGVTLQDVPRILVNTHLHLAASLMVLAPGAVSKDKAKAMGVEAARGFEAKAYAIMQAAHRPRALVHWPAHSKG